MLCLIEFDEDTAAVVDLIRKLVQEHQMPLEEKKLRGLAVEPQDQVAGTAAAQAVGLWCLAPPAALHAANNPTRGDKPCNAEYFWPRAPR